MSDWNPSLYLHFSAERSRPAVELLARVPLENVEYVAYVADLGCGPGNSTALLQQRWPAARITGIDSSPAMIAEARSALPDCQFVEADIRNWQPVQALDLIFANASLQWLPDHYELFPHLVSLLNPQGVLAVQMPDNWLEPTHVLMREVAWEQNYPDRGREPLAGVHAYYDILSEAGCEVDIWRTTYYHQMPSHQAIIDWVTATGLRPWLQDLTESEQQLFLKRYHQMLEEQYPLQENGQILLAFPRLFIVARRME
ncbi:trans-aconitate 2-methyltransferase [Shigella flexneri]